jgi:ATP-dependent Clp protease, protease subunit
MSEPMALPDLVRARLFDQRIVSLRGALTDEVAGLVCAQLMTLDASGDDSVTLFVDSGEGTLSAAFAVMDTIDLLGVPVHVTCLGRADGPAVGVVAVGARRRASRHARFHLSAPRAVVAGTAGDMERWISHHQQQLDNFITRLSEATRQPVEHLEADLDIGRFLNAEDALRYGLIDEIWQPDRSGSPPPDRPPLGFRPPGR